ncbi:MAG: hypothetical protein JSV16_12375, partial [Candidatus Hydrogenedentota bacterium]
PLSPENPIVLGAGPLIGAPVPGAAKVAGTTKFALPAAEDGRCYVASGASGSQRFGVMLKRAGYDHLVITGRASKPVYIRILDDDVGIIDADRLWGTKDAYETVDELKHDLGDCGVLSIGAAGENQVKFALALTDKKSTLGRNGFGAVMGSKNLKAVCVRGTKPVKLKDRERLRTALAPLLESLKENPMMPLFHEMGIHAGWEYWKHLLNPGVWPKDKWDELYGMDKCREAVERTHGCTGCVIKCKPVQRVSDGEWKGVQTETSHFLHVAGMGQTLGIEDWRPMVKLLEVCNRAGSCAVSSVGLLAMATVCFEMGALTEEQTGGVKLARGDFPGYLSMLEKIIKREDLGDALAEGWFEAAKHLDLDPHAFLGLIKGAPCIYDARNTHMDPRIFHMIVNPRGAHHPQCHWTTSIPMQPLERIRSDFMMTGAGQKETERIFGTEDFNCARLTRHIQDVGMAYDCLGTCVIYPLAGAPLNVNALAEFYSATTGLETSPAELKTSGERAFNLLKLLNVREGFSRKDDMSPQLWFQPKSTPDGDEELKDYYGRKRLDEKDMEGMLDDYYGERGWDLKSGTPTRDKLDELGLAEYVKDESAH